MGRTWTTVPAVRENVPLMIGLMGQTSGGKTYSALRLATGIQKVTGGSITLIDTETGRGRHYADRFKYDYQSFEAPFGSIDYLDAITHAHNRGAKVIIVDSMSHEHDGIGGHLEQHEKETERLAKLWGVSEGKAQWSAWGPPKAARRRMLQGILALPICTILCFRAKVKRAQEKNERGKNEIIELGTLPVAGEDIVLEATLNGLLVNGCRGVPRFEGETEREKLLFKIPEQFTTLFGVASPLSEDHGESMARWAAGGGVEFYALERRIATATTKDEMNAASKAAGDAREAREINDAEFEGLKALYLRRRAELARAPKRKERDLGSADEPTPPAAAAPPPEAA